MTSFSVKLMFIELALGVIFLAYELLTGHPWTQDGVAWTMDQNFHFNIALGFFTAAGFTVILGAVIGSIGKERGSKE
jgi:hypothetical protein